MTEKNAFDPCQTAAAGESRRKWPLKAAPGEGSWQRVLVRGYGFIRLYLPGSGPEGILEAGRLGPLVFQGLCEPSAEAGRLCDAPGESKA